MTTVALTGEVRKAHDDYTQALRGLLDGLWAGPECQTPAIELER
jgi:hypothetical protein